ncbi:MAG: 2-hydroxyglutaryl-CoA dehydratase [Firmicutes bacterium]|nr:2-hydroxyglutaryl-CoA dehydratase [Bacillota bacterium]
MYTMGIDIGSSSSKVVILEDGKKIAGEAVIPVGTGTSGPTRALDEALKRAGLTLDDIAWTVATGYGRMTFGAANEQISEISCQAKGVHHLLPAARTIIDIGGQDAKAIQLDDQGFVTKFVMNEKCAAGTGRFLEVMARVLECEVSQLAQIAEEAAQVVTISSTCTVFAESEVISQLAAGRSRADVVAGIHQSVARRVAGLVGRVGLVPQVVLTGGVAKNAGVVKALEQELKTPITIAPMPQITAALGAALYAYQSGSKGCESFNSR